MQENERGQTKAIFHNIMVCWAVLAKAELFYLPSATWLLLENGREQVGNWAEIKDAAQCFSVIFPCICMILGLSYPGREPKARRLLDNPAGLHLLLSARPKTHWVSWKWFQRTPRSWEHWVLKGLQMDWIAAGVVNLIYIYIIKHCVFLPSLNLKEPKNGIYELYQNFQ